MLIGFVHPRFPSAEGTGATHSATQVVSGLVKAGHTVHVYCTATPEEEIGIDDVELRDLSGKSSHPHSPTRLNKEIEQRLGELEKYDIFHSYLTPLIPAIAKVGAQYDVGTAVTLNAYGGVCAKNDLLYLNKAHCQSKSTLKCLHCLARTQFGANENKYIYEMASKMFSLRLINSGERRLKHIDKFRAPSEHVRENYSEFGFESDKISVIPHPVDERFRIDHQSDFNDPYRLLYVGSLDKHKGVETLIPLMAALKSEAHNFRLTIIGTGPLQSTLQQEAKDKNLENTINFRGFISNGELPKVYAAHDIFIYPGIWEEPLARVYLEALGTGTPIVTSSYGHIDSIVGDAGLLTDGSVEGFQEAVLELISENKLPDLSEAATKQVQAYNRSHVVQQIETMYSSIVK